MSLPVKQLYIDSRFRTPDSISTSLFKFQLARNIYMPKNTVFFIEDVCIPNTWLTIETDVNDKLYILYDGHNAVVLTLNQGQYTAASLAAQINTQIGSNGVVRNNLTCIADTVYNTINHPHLRWEQENIQNLD